MEGMADAWFESPAGTFGKIISAKMIDDVRAAPDRSRRAPMIKSFFAAFFLAFLCLDYAPALCSDITGEVVGPQGPVAGTQVTVTDSGGSVVGQATTNDAGRYCITGLSPGNYKTAVNPPAGAGFKTGAANDAVPAEGLTEDWSLSSAALASSSANPPGACGAAYLGGSGALIAGGALVVATGAGLGACAGAGCFSGGGGGDPPASASK